MPGLARLAVGASDDAVGLFPDWLVQRKRLPACSDQRVRSSCPGIPSNECHISSVDLELLECLGVIQRQELVLDALSKSLIELTIRAASFHPVWVACSENSIKYLLTC